MKAALVIAFLALLLWAICLFLLRHCTAGFLGYPDVWKSEKARKAYMVCAHLSMLLMLIALIIIFTAM